jgi:hypothetical protein
VAKIVRIHEYEQTANNSLHELDKKHARNISHAAPEQYFSENSLSNHLTILKSHFTCGGGHCTLD